MSKNNGQKTPPSIIALPSYKVEEWEAFAQTSSPKGYSHFDSRNIFLGSYIGESKNDATQIYKWVMVPSNIESHSFLPFIHYTITSTKVSWMDDADELNSAAEKQIGANLKKKTKTREIYYASHFDRCVYQYYAFQLNYFYDQWADTHQISDSVIAYRHNSGKSPIDFAKQSFDYISTTEQCLVIVCDFSNFFDNIDCHVLKQNLCEVLGVDYLPNDWFAVFKSVTNHSWVNIDDIVTLLKNSEFYKQSNTRPRGYSVMTLNKWDKIPDIQTFKTLLHKHNQRYTNPRRQISIQSRTKLKAKTKSRNVQLKIDRGIPQGSPISAVLSNVYMMHFDETLQQLVTSLGGRYMRYSDDLIIMLPVNTIEKCAEYATKVSDFFSNFSDLVIFNTDKTNKLIFSHGSFYGVDSATFYKRQNLSYLGFVFDGNSVRLCQSGITKYYSRMRKKARSYVHQQKAGKSRFPRQLYQQYATSSPKFAKRKQNSQHQPCLVRGNFITYLSLVQRKFGAKFKDPHAKALVRRSRHKVAKAIKEFKKKH